MKKILTVLTVSALMFGAQARAQIVNFQVNSGAQYSGPGVLGTGNEYWNRVAPSGVTSSTASDGTTASTDGFSYSGNLYNAGNAATLTLFTPYAYTFGATQSINFIGLKDGVYNLVLFGINAGYHNGAGTAFSVSNTLLPATEASTMKTTETNSSTFAAGNNYVEFTDVAVVDGKISASFSPSKGTEGDFNGAQLQYVGASIPEPSSVALVAISLGSLALLLRRRPTA